MNQTISYLFETNAIRFCEENKPFWYTSGKIGPYFINTHFVYGSEEEASTLLSYIDEQLADKMNLPANVFKKVKKQYEANEIYHNIIQSLMQMIQKNIPIDEIDYVSGGERRDWFFSNMIANLLGKPHITIYKDLSMVVSDAEFTKVEEVSSLEGKKVLHIADLITVASSYVKLWIPAIEQKQGKMLWSCVVVDRMQGGQEKMAEKGVTSYSLVQVDKGLFQEAVSMGIINEGQQEMLNGFFENPDETMKQFLIEHPEFIENSLNADEKTKKRATILVEQDLYGLKK